MKKPKELEAWGRAKARERYAVGGIVPKPVGDEPSIKDHLWSERERDIADRNEDAKREGRRPPPGRPKQYELEENRGRVLRQDPEQLPKELNVSPDDYLSGEDRDI